jgi:hypothetical protein
MMFASYIILPPGSSRSVDRLQAAILSDSKPTARQKKSDWFHLWITRKFSVTR